ncbi:universal stress protein [Nocardia takedensis]|uniref:universal stress protein n=1 Tax=Nocardia takedensis TaxID=259390 RepID=UPI000314566B|nr:universal stress protein [Nocardia takedensis]
MESHAPARSSTAAVVVGVNRSDGSDIALRWAAEIAARDRRPLHIVHGLDLLSWLSGPGGRDMVRPEFFESLREYGTTLLRAATAAAREIEPDITVTTEISDDSPARLLIERSKTAHLVVLGVTPDTGTLAHLGSTLLEVTGHGHGSIAVVRTRSDGRILYHGPVVVGIDGSPVSESAIAAAFAEASARGTDLVAVHSWSDWDTGRFADRQATALDADALETVEQAILAERLAGWQEKYPDVSVTRKVYLAGPSEALTQQSERAQLVVVGSRGRGGFRGLLLGSTGNFLVQHARCPVLVAHPG